MLTDRGQNRTGEHMEQFSAQDPDLYCMLLYSADLINGAVIRGSKPWEKGDLSGQPLCGQQAGVEIGKGRPGWHLGSRGKAL